MMRYVALFVIPGRAEGAGPESILRSAGVMDSGFAPSLAPRNDSYSRHKKRARLCASFAPAAGVVPREAVLKPYIGGREG
jgi:hypothetical protein